MAVHRVIHCQRDLDGAHQWVLDLFGGYCLPVVSRQPLRIQELKSCVSVEAFLKRGPVDVDGFLEQQFIVVSGHANHCGLLPLDGMLVIPFMLRYCRLLQCPSSTGPLVFPQPSL